MSFDPKVWTSDAPTVGEGAYYWWSDGCAPVIADLDPRGFNWEASVERRSILPVPSAAEHAALVRVAEAAEVVDGEPTSAVKLGVLSAALARLDAARKERVA